MAPYQVRKIKENYTKHEQKFYLKINKYSPHKTYEN